MRDLGLRVPITPDNAGGLAPATPSDRSDHPDARTRTAVAPSRAAPENANLPKRALATGISRHYVASVCFSQAIYGAAYPQGRSHDDVIL